MFYKKGFTLIEFSLVIAITIILGVVAFVNLYPGRTRIDLTGASQKVVALLRQAQAKSASQAEGVGWGVHFDNTNPSSPTYSLFSGGTFIAASNRGTFSLPTGVCFVNIDPGASLDINFASLSGSLISTSTTVWLGGCTGDVVWALGNRMTNYTFPIYTPATAYNNYLYAVGSFSSNDGPTTVHYAKINDEGTVGTWQVTSAMPLKTIYEPAIAVGGFMYTLGGFQSSAGIENIVYYAPVNSDGTLGSFSVTAPIPSALLGASAVTYNGYIYTLGGHNSSNQDVPNVFYAKPNTNGTIDSWSSGTSLPQSGSYLPSVAYNGYVYVFENSSLYAAPINVTDGSLGSWLSLTTLPGSIDGYLPTLAYNGYIYAFGNDQMYRSKVNLTDGSVGAWSTGSSAIKTSSGMPAAAYNAHIYAIEFDGNVPGSPVYVGSLGTSQIIISPQGSINAKF